MARTRLTPLTALATFIITCAFATAALAADPVNAVTGDASWAELRRGSADLADEDDRLNTHLEWVEARLRAADTSELSNDAAARRANLLDELRSYRLAGVFPRHNEITDGRQPRWIDHEGRVCAVGYLVSASGAHDLFERVARNHEYDYVPDMQVPELTSWAATHGFTVTELAMIQPMYRGGGGVRIPTPQEEEERLAELERQRRIPRPLRPERVDTTLAKAMKNREIRRTCFGKQTGKWNVQARATVDEDVTVSVEVTVRRQDAKEVLKAESRCVSKELAKAMKTFLEEVNYTVAKQFTREHASLIEIPDGGAIERGFFERAAYERHHRLTRQAALARCIADSSVADAPLTIPLTVSSWNGQVSLRWPEIPNRDDKDHLKLNWCVQDVLTYERAKVYGIWDYKFSVEIGADGTVRVK